jgi:hypothetical protein
MQLTIRRRSPTGNSIVGFADLATLAGMVGAHLEKNPSDQLVISRARDVSEEDVAGRVEKDLKELELA